MLSIARVSPRYQLTLPQDVRQALGCEPNDRIAFRSDASGRIYIENMKAIEVSSVRGMLRPADDDAAETEVAYRTYRDASVDGFTDGGDFE
ncbi:type II toxin-antitoxin system PrlF family antitoxin [Alicyclobacillus sp. SP_1]|jgi:bifunctional DNA-binding transcriptional regulator/antitoxin component of YhaV-PrlF toxin-antitoxin module|uniref:AbrB/MazE/SpoVT family DNA-binding domain-containing protein n=1 Tax=Alicyclobacillus sp. SP_1 TaxID=2942475 RepID=UPI0021586A01|nr:type II toxin-antitoxin system PrlF family antitoxin [Alicyclobacillus sp. SP_1]